MAFSVDEVHAKLREKSKGVNQSLAWNIKVDYTLHIFSSHHSKGPRKHNDDTPAEILATK